MTSELTKEATIKRYRIDACSEWEGVRVRCEEHPKGNWVAFDDHIAHTAALRAENDRLREQVRLAVEARKAYRNAYIKADSPAEYVAANAAEQADAALRAAGVA